MASKFIIWLGLYEKALHKYNGILPNKKCI